MPDLQTWANLAEIVGGAAVVGGVLYAAIQIHQQKAQRTQTAVLQMFQSFQDDTFGRAVRLVVSLPDDADPRAISKDKDMEEAAIRVASAYAAVGYALELGALPAKAAASWDTGLPQLVWRKLRRWVHAGRKRGGLPTLYRNFEWAATYFEQRWPLPARPPSPPADTASPTPLRISPSPPPTATVDSDPGGGGDRSIRGDDEPHPPV